ncbi:MAG: hypothetical protein WBL07_09890 [Thiothrix litoralis]|jgi:protein-S-isoprenylcysteine O-methyltransferase Ste14|uniref:hypothetical protein n=1 Tax=Thiothrix litoralis TaxID=2891210 RepID=UPI003C76321B
MKALTETVIGLFDLAEAEGRLLQQKLVQTFGVALLMLMAAVLVLFASTLFMLALYQLLITHWSPPLTLFVIGVACLSLAGVSLWIAMHTHRQR